MRDSRRVVGWPCAFSHDCSESDPRCLCTTRWAEPPGASRSNAASRSRCRAALPMRTGGLDHTASKRTSGSRPLSSGSASTCTVCTLPSSLAAALAAHSSTARGFTSTAQTLADGARTASASATGPYPQPRSSRLEASGAGLAPRSMSSAVPSSRCPCENTPVSLASSRLRPSTITSSRLGEDFGAGWSRWSEK